MFEVQYQFVSSQNFDVSGLSSFFDQPLGNGGQTPASTTNIRFNDDPLRLPFFGTPNPPSVTQAPVPQQIPICHQQFCDQDYQARNIPYSQALEIVNTRDYEEETFASAEDVVRRRRKKRSDPIGIKIEITRFRNRSIIDPVQMENNGWVPIQRGQRSRTSWNPSLNERQSEEALATRYLVLPVVGKAPPDQPQPGEPGGGRLPIAVDAKAALALALVPPDHFPVSLMPPFTDPGNFPAVCVIFSESDFDSIEGFLATGSAKRRSKRFINPRRFRQMYHRYSQNIRRFFTSKRRPRNMASHPNKRPIQFSSPERPHHTFSEQPTFRHIPDPKPRPVQVHSSYVKPKRVIAPRLFGVRCRARFVDRPCALGTTCDARGATIRSPIFNPSQPRVDLFPSTADNLTHPIIFNHRHLWNQETFLHLGTQRNNFEIERQTGEIFFTSAPPECRSERRDECLK